MDPISIPVVIPDVVAELGGGTVCGLGDGRTGFSILHFSVVLPRPPVIRLTRM